MYKDRQPVFGKHYIRLAWQVLAVQTESISPGVKVPPNILLRARVF